MSQPYVVSFGSWVPDGANAAYEMDYQWSATEVPLAEVSDMVYANGSYTSIKSGVTIGTLAAACLGAFAAVDTSGDVQIYAGTSSDLYHWTGSAWSSVGSGYSAAHWSFSQFNGCINATNGVDDPQSMSVGGSAFGQMSTGAPTANVAGVINDFQVLGDVTASAQTQTVYGDATEIAYPNRVHWSAINDDTNFPTINTDKALAFESGAQDLPGEFGPVMFVAGTQQYGIILQRTGIVRANYVGGDVVFSFVPFERKRGLVARTAACQVGTYVFFLSDSGFFVTEGSSVEPIGHLDGQSVVDGWFWDNVNTSALDAINAAYDADTHSVYFAIPTGSSTTADTLLIFNTMQKKWTKASMNTEMLFTDNDGSRHVLGVFDTSHDYQRLTGSAKSGYIETYDMAFVDGLRRLVTGVKPHCSGAPTVEVGHRTKLEDAVSYSSAVSVDSFTGIAPFLVSDAFHRIRLTGTSMNPVYGASVFSQKQGYY